MCHSTDAFDLKNIVKFRRNEKKLCGRAGGGVVESKEDKKYMTKTPTRNFGTFSDLDLA